MRPVAQLECTQVGLCAPFWRRKSFFCYYSILPYFVCYFHPLPPGLFWGWCWTLFFFFFFWGGMFLISVLSMYREDGVGNIRFFPSFFSFPLSLMFGIPLLLRYLKLLYFSLESSRRELFLIQMTPRVIVPQGYSR